MQEFHWRDKTKHLILSFIISIIVLLSFESFKYALLVIVVLTVIKELYDHFKKGKDTIYHSFVDAIYNLIGLGLAYLIYLTII
ncbi:hypothetical protein KKA15_06215 [Patescibacteria group bacterium]|nr:hypothetical protein [Patescibacteria group bacterium]